MANRQASSAALEALGKVILCLLTFSCLLWMFLIWLSRRTFCSNGDFVRRGAERRSVDCPVLSWTAEIPLDSGVVWGLGPGQISPFPLFSPSCLHFPSSSVDQFSSSFLVHSLPVHSCSPVYSSISDLLHSILACYHFGGKFEFQISNSPLAKQKRDIVASGWWSGGVLARWRQQ